MGLRRDRNKPLIAVRSSSPELSIKRSIATGRPERLELRLKFFCDCSSARAVNYGYPMVGSYPPRSAREEDLRFPRTGLQLVPARRPACLNMLHKRLRKFGPSLNRSVIIPIHLHVLPQGRSPTSSLRELKELVPATTVHTLISFFQLMFNDGSIEHHKINISNRISSENRGCFNCWGLMRQNP